MAELSHNVVSPTTFRVEYKRTGNGPAMFQRHVKFQVSSYPTPSLSCALTLFRPFLAGRY